MTNDMDGDVFETQLIKNAVAPFNDILPVALPDVKDGVMRAFELEDLNRCVDTTAYASNVLWSLRRYFEKNPVDGWKLVGRRDCLHMKHESDGLEMRFTKAFKFTGALSRLVVMDRGEEHICREGFAPRKNCSSCLVIAHH